MEHQWVPFTDDMVICENCGNVCDEAAEKDEWEAECTPDEMLVEKGGENPWQ